MVARDAGSNVVRAPVPVRGSGVAFVRVELRENAGRHAQAVAQPRYKLDTMQARVDARAQAGFSCNAQLRKTEELLLLVKLISVEATLPKSMFTKKVQIFTSKPSCARKSISGKKSNTIT